MEEVVVLPKRGVTKRLDKVIEALERMLNNAKWKFEDERFYEPLKEVGLGDYSEEGILDDPWYDAQCVAFTLRVLKKVRDG